MYTIRECFVRNAGVVSGIGRQIMKITVIIPSLNPDDKLVQVVEGLIQKGFDDIVLVNDGSDEAHMKPFEKVGKYNEPQSNPVRAGNYFGRWRDGTGGRSCVYFLCRPV